MLDLWKPGLVTVEEPKPVEYVIRNDGPKPELPSKMVGVMTPATRELHARLEQVRLASLAGERGWFPIVSVPVSPDGDGPRVKRITWNLAKSHPRKYGWNRYTITEKSNDGQEWRSLWAKYTPELDQRIVADRGARVVETPGPTAQNGAEAAPSAAPAPRPHPEALKGAPALAGMDWTQDTVDDGAGHVAGPVAPGGGWGSSNG